MGQDGMEPEAAQEGEARCALVLVQASLGGGCAG